MRFKALKIQTDMNIPNLSESSLYEKFVKNNSRSFVSEVNRSFKIKVYGLGHNKLVGVYGLLNLLGYDLTEKTLKSALSSEKQVLKFSFRRGLQVSFYSI